MLALENSCYGYRFSCPTCPFVFHIQKKLSSRWYPKLKQIDEILSDSEMWKNVDSTDEKCPKCKLCLWIAIRTVRSSKFDWCTLNQSL